MELPDLALFAAIRANDAQQLERALSEGASVNSTMNDENCLIDELEHFSVEGGNFSAGRPMTAHWFAIVLGRGRIAKLLRERGADPHDSYSAEAIQRLAVLRVAAKCRRRRLPR